MSHPSRIAICLFALVALSLSKAEAGPPPGHGGHSSSGFGFSIGPGSGISIGVGSVPSHYGYGSGYRGYYNNDYYGRNIYGGSGVYFGGGSHDFRWGVGIPFGYDDYDWYAPYYNSYSGRYYNYGQGYYQSPAYYEDNNLQQPNTQQTMEHPPVPTAGQVARLTDDQLKMMISVALDAYSKELDEFNTGSGWKKHFQLAELKEKITSAKTGALDSATRSLVTEISQKFDAAAKDPTYAVITEPWSFKTLLVALKEYSLPATDRVAHELNAKTKTLHKSLDIITTGEGWITYLHLKDLEKLLEEPTSNNADRAKKLEKFLEKFDEVAQNPQYKTVADLRGFDVTKSALQQYINALQTDTTKKDVVLPPPPANNPGEASL